MKPAGQNRGFSMIELLVVVGIMIVMAAVSVPSVMTSLRRYTLGGAATDMANIIQRARYEAIKRNTRITVRSTVIPPVTGRRYLYIDLNKDGFIGLNGANTGQNSEPVIVLPSQVKFVNPLPAGSPTGFPPAAGYGVPTPNPACITFDQRGVLIFGANAESPPDPPIVTPAACSALAMTTYVIYLAYTQGAQNLDYRAVVATPMGKTKIWRGVGAGALWSYP